MPVNKDGKVLISDEGNIYNSSDTTMLQPEQVKELYKKKIDEAIRATQIWGEGLTGFTDGEKKTRYGMGRKGTKCEGVDCSGYVGDQYVKNLGYDMPASQTSEELWNNSAQKKTYTPDSFLADLENVQHGSIVAFDLGNFKHDKGRKYGIDHIGFIERDNQGQVWINESSSSHRGPSRTLISDRVGGLSKIFKKDFKNVYVGYYPPILPDNTALPANSINEQGWSIQPVEVIPQPKPESRVSSFQQPTQFKKGGFLRTSRYSGRTYYYHEY